MSSAEDDERPPISVVPAEANVLYSRVLRDYLLCAAVQGVLEIRWSAAIPAEAVKHLTENIAGFDAADGTDWPFRGSAARPTTRPLPRSVVLGHRT